MIICSYGSIIKYNLILSNTCSIIKEIIKEGKCRLSGYLPLIRAVPQKGVRICMGRKMEKSRVEIAAQKHRNGYNCCQAVVCTYGDLLGMDERTAFRASEAYGLGIAGMFETCGSVCGMIMLAGLKNSDGNMEAPKSKFETFELGRSMAEEFKNKNTSILCRDLRGTDGKTDRLRSCRGCVIDCARLVEERIFPERFSAYDGPEE